MRRDVAVTLLIDASSSNGIAMATGSGALVLLPTANTSAWTAVPVSSASLAVKILDTCDVNVDGKPGLCSVPSYYASCPVSQTNKLPHPEL
jgi:hypothetical protein